MQVTVDRPAKVLAYQLRRLEVQLEAADQVDVERIEIAEQRLEPEPAPLRNAARQSLAASRVAQVVEHDAVVWLGNLDRRGVWRGVIHRCDELTRRVGQIAAHLEDRHELPV